jgi:type II secretory pathway component PulF
MMRALKLILEVLFWTLAAGAVLFAVGVAVGMSLWPILGYFAAVAVLGALPLIQWIVRLIRRRRAATLLAYLEQAVRLNLPLPRMLWAAQRSEPGKLSRQLRALRQRLEEGLPIGAAVHASVPELTARASSLIEVGERIGRLPQALSRLVREEASAARRDVATVWFYRAYPVVMALVLATVLSMLLVFVIPKFEMIFRDFNIQLPGITQAVLEVSRDLGPLLLLLTCVAVFYLAGNALWDMVHPRDGAPTVLGSLRDRLLWTLPVSHGLARDRGLADVCETVAEALHVGTPADRALTEASRIQTNAVLRQRVARWAGAAGEGRSLAEAARAAGMPAMIPGMLGSARGTDEAADVFGFLARYYGSRYSATATMLQAAVIPVTVFIFAFLVASVALALFVPIIHLLNATMVQTSYL